MGEKPGAIGNTFGEHIGNLENLMGTHWEHVENKGKMKKILLPPPPHTQNLKEKNNKALWLHAEPSHWLHEISISKTVHHHFWPGLIYPRYKQGVLISI
jgi:hypothetical protein